MKYVIGLAIGLAVSFSASASLWQDVPAQVNNEPTRSSKIISQVPALKNARTLHLNENELQLKLSQAPHEDVGGLSATIKLPLPDGGYSTFVIQNSPVMHPALARQFKNIRTFRVFDIENSSNQGRLDVTPAGFHSMFDYNGKTVFIDPLGNSGQYQSYFKEDYAKQMSDTNHSAVVCLTNESSALKGYHYSPRQKNSNDEVASNITFGEGLRTYRLAVAATGEYSTFHGRTVERSLAAIVTTINRVNQIYIRDLAIRFELVANNSQVIYIDGNTDPYTDDDLEALIAEVGADLDANIGNENYDVGHVFGRAGGGLARFASACGANKARGVSTSPNPVTDSFFVELVAHELGHQFAADHTFNATTEGCEGNRVADSAYEVGSGTTIMAYAGLCGNENVAIESDDYFHHHSIVQINEYKADPLFGGSCGTSLEATNAVPIPIAGADGDIPRSTPFTLTGSATDLDSGDTLSYIWEQFDLGVATSGRPTQVDDGSRPIFRSFPPRASPSRTFPRLTNVITEIPTYGELLPTTTRDLNFRFTVRDGNGGVASDSLKLSVHADAGPFTVSTPSTEWTAGSSQTINWDVANTTAAPINCANVEVSLSLDGGRNYGSPIVALTANDGSEVITVPSEITTEGRVRVACATQPFFAINNANITIESPVVNATPVANDDSFVVTQDSNGASLAVLSNDSDSDGDMLSISSVGSFNNGGSATISAAALLYTPANGFTGTETFTYSVSDGEGGTASATVTVTITESINTEPVANADNYSVAQNAAARSLPVLGNDSDADGDSLSIASITNISNGGTATITNTTISYQPAAGFSGTETFVYTVVDGRGGMATATVTVTVTALSTGGNGSTGGGGGGGSVDLFILILLILSSVLRSVHLDKGAFRFSEFFVEQTTYDASIK